MTEITQIVEQINKSVHDMRQDIDSKMASMAQGKAVSELESKINKQNDDIDSLLTKFAEINKQNLLMASQKEGVLTPEQLNQKHAFSGLLRGKTGDIDVKALSSLTNPDGGFLVPRDTSGRLVRKIQLYSPVRQYASAQAISGDALTGIIDNQTFGSGWVGQAASRPTTTNAQLGQWKIDCAEMYANPATTQTLLDDAEIDVEGWIIARLAEEFGRLESDAFINGDGVGKPKGLLSYTLATTTDASRAWGTVQKVKTGVNGGFAATPNGGDALINLMTALHPKYWGMAKFFMNRYTLGEVRKLKDSDGNYIWQPDFSAGVMGTVLGQAVDSSFDHMPSITTGSKSIIFGDLASAYQIVDKVGIRVLRDAYTNKPYVQFYSTKRVGGGVVNSEAYKVLTFEA